MLLLVTIGLVLAGLVLLIVGFVQDSLSYIFFSIACAAVAAIALIVFGRLSRRRSLQVALDGGGAKLPGERQHAPGRRPSTLRPATAARGRATRPPVRRVEDTAPPGRPPPLRLRPDRWSRNRRRPCATGGRGRLGADRFGGGADRVQDAVTTAPAAIDGWDKEGDWGEH